MNDKISLDDLLRWRNLRALAESFKEQLNIFEVYMQQKHKLGQNALVAPDGTISYPEQPPPRPVDPAIPVPPSNIVTADFTVPAT